MEKVISLLSEIEEKAAKIIESTSTEKERLHNQFEIDLKQLDEQIMSDTTKKLDEIKLKINLSLEEEKSKIMEDCNYQIESLEIDFAKNHNDLVNKVFHNIIGA